MKCFISCVPGLESVLFKELKSLGVGSARRIKGGVEFDQNFLDRGMQSGVGSHLLERVALFPAKSFSELEKRVMKSELPSLPSISKIDVVCRKSKLIHARAVKERMTRFLGARGVKFDEENGRRLMIRIHYDMLTMSLDSCLHQRGYRLEGGKAPLREDIARSIVLASQWKDDEALFGIMLNDFQFNCF